MCLGFYKIPLAFDAHANQVRVQYLAQFQGVSFDIVHEGEDNIAVVRALLSDFDHDFLQTLPGVEYIGEVWP